MTDKDHYSEALRQIAEEACGIPGHAVAVGCRSAWFAMMALDPNCHEECSKCHGSEQQERPEVFRMWQEDDDGNKTYFAADEYMRCEWCRGTGRQLKGHAYGEAR